MEARTCAPSAHTSCGSRSGTVPHVGWEHLCCKNSCHRSTSTMVVEDDIARSGGRAVPQMGSTGGRPRTPSWSWLPPSVSTRHPGTCARVWSRPNRFDHSPGKRGPEHAWCTCLSQCPTSHSTRPGRNKNMKPRLINLKPIVKVIQCFYPWKC